MLSVPLAANLNSYLQNSGPIRTHSGMEQHGRPVWIRVASRFLAQSVRSKLNLLDWALTSAFRPEVSARLYLEGTSFLAEATALPKSLSWWNCPPFATSLSFVVSASTETTVTL